LRFTRDGVGKSFHLSPNKKKRKKGEGGEREEDNTEPTNVIQRKKKNYKDFNRLEKSLPRLWSFKIAIRNERDEELTSFRQEEKIKNSKPETGTAAGRKEGPGAKIKKRRRKTDKEEKGERRGTCQKDDLGAGERVLCKKLAWKNKRKG